MAIVWLLLYLACRYRPGNWPVAAVHITTRITRDTWWNSMWSGSKDFGRSIPRGRGLEKRGEGAGGVADLIPGNR